MMVMVTRSLHSWLGPHLTRSQFWQSLQKANFDAFESEVRMHLNYIFISQAQNVLHRALQYRTGQMQLNQSNHIRMHLNLKFDGILLLIY